MWTKLVGFGVSLLLLTSSLLALESRLHWHENILFPDEYRSFFHHSLRWELRSKSVSNWRFYGALQAHYLQALSGEGPILDLSSPVMQMDKGMLALDRYYGEYQNKAFRLSVGKMGVNWHSPSRLGISNLLSQSSFAPLSRWYVGRHAIKLTRYLSETDDVTGLLSLPLYQDFSDDLNPISGLQWIRNSDLGEWSLGALYDSGQQWGYLSMALQLQYAGMDWVLDVLGGRGDADQGLEFSLGRMGALGPIHWVAEYWQHDPGLKRIAMAEGALLASRLSQRHFGVLGLSYQRGLWEQVSVTGLWGMQTGSLLALLDLTVPFYWDIDLSVSLQQGALGTSSDGIGDRLINMSFRKVI